VLELATSTVSSAAAQVYNTSSETFQAVGSLNTARESAATVVLPNNMVLVAGGGNCVPSAYGGEATGAFLCTALSSAELYNEATQTFTFAGTAFGTNPSGGMTIARSGPSATLIEGSGTSLDGQVLIMGGSTGISFLYASSPPGAPGEAALNTGELYNPATDTFTALPSAVPGCPAGESSASTPACTDALPSVCALPTVQTPITSISESGTTVTVTTAANPPGLTVNSSVVIAGVVNPTTGIAISGYNNVFTVATIPTANTFTFTDATSGLVSATSGYASAGNILSASETGTTVTVNTTANPSGLLVGSPVTVSAVKIGTSFATNGYNGEYVVTGIPSSTSFTYTPTGPASPITSTSESGTTVTVTSAANPTGLTVGNQVIIAGVSVAGYNGTFTVLTINGTAHTFTYTATSGLAAGTGGTATAVTESLAAASGGGASTANTFECGMVDQGAALIPGGSGDVLLAGGDFITFLGESSNYSFIFDPSTETFSKTTGNLATPRELASLLAIPSEGTVVSFGGVEANSAVCPANSGEIVATTLTSAEVYDPATQMWGTTANSMFAKRAVTATPINAGTLAGDVILPGGVDVEAGTFPSTCVGLTSLVQNAQSKTDLYEPGTGSGGTFVASTGALNQAREGASQGVIGAGTNETLILLGGGACTNGSLESAPIGTSEASTLCGAASAETDFSELYNQSTQMFTVGSQSA
jgi:hypothetical protein